MQASQLELNLWNNLSAAAASPLAVNMDEFMSLVCQFEAQATDLKHYHLSLDCIQVGIDLID